MNGCFWTHSSIRITALFLNETGGRSHIYQAVWIFFLVERLFGFTIAFELPYYFSQFLVPSELRFF